MSFPVAITSGQVISDLKLLEPDVFLESRGAIWTSYDRSQYESLLGLSFNHDKCSISKKNVLRGIHGDHKTWKLISCLHGDITCVFVDMRRDSESYLKHEVLRLNNEYRVQVLIPPSIGNSFYVHSELAVYFYKLAYDGSYADADEQFTIAWNDPQLGINWPCDDPILSDRDSRL